MGRPIMDGNDGGEFNRVLVVEDDESQRKTLCAILRDEGLQPVGCASAAEAMTRIAEEDFPVAVLDYRLPDDSGVHVLEHLRRVTGPVRVILHTAYGSFESAKRALNLGAFAYVEKMQSPEELIRQVHRAIDEIAAELVWEFDDCLRSVTRFAPDLILQLDREGGVTFGNHNLAGHDQEALLGEPIYTHVAERHHAGLRKALETVFERGDPQELELMARSSDGTEHWYECRLGPVVARRRIVRAVVVARDVTAKRRDAGPATTRPG